MNRKERSQVKVARAHAQAAKAQAKVDKLRKKNSKRNSLENTMIIAAMLGMVVLAAVATIVGLTEEDK